MQGIIAGRKPVMEALRAGTNIEKIVFLLGVQGTVIEEIRHAAERNNVPVSQASRQEFRELASDATTQGVVAIVRQAKTFVGLDEIVRAAEARNEKPLILILDSIEDPQNLGALVRTAECAGVHGVVIPKHHAASVTPAVVKASAGATEHMAMAEVTNIVSTMDDLKERGFWTAGVAVEGDIPFTGFDGRGDRHRK
jgi:23S rRNA (guanosine2251-2'-O)-methyltransferase